MKRKCCMNYDNPEYKKDYPPCNGKVKVRGIWGNQMSLSLCDAHYEYIKKVGEWYQEATKDINL